MKNTKSQLTILLIQTTNTKPKKISQSLNSPHLNANVAPLDFGKGMKFMQRPKDVVNMGATANTKKH